MTEIEASQVQVGELGTYLARPVGGGTGQGMLLLPMITGIGEQLRDWADELAGRGITALAWDPFKGRSTDNSTIAQYYPGADHGFSDRSRQEKPVNFEAFRLSWPQVLAFIDVTTA